MNQIVKWIRGEVRLCITGAAPQEVLNALSKAGIPFWNICREDDTCYSISVLPRDRIKAERLALHAYCQVEAVDERSFILRYRQMKKRPVFFCGMLLTLAASFLLQSFVWTIDVQGAETIHPQEVIRALEEENVKFGTWAASVDSQKLKLKMLAKMPTISWMAVNRTGGKLTVLLTEAAVDADNGQAQPSSLIATRDGIVTDFTVLEGMRLCSRGDTVKAGQLLVSGLEDYGLFLKAVCAQGEVYARTWYSGALVAPANTLQKAYTGREWTQVSILFGRKRIKLYGNSGIFNDSCDKMVEVKTLAFPGYTLPLTVEIVTYREYELQSLPAQESMVKERLLKTWRMNLLDAMIAGNVENTEYNFLRSGDLYVLYADSVCNEMIAKQLPIQQIYEGENDGGTNHQRRTD